MMAALPTTEHDTPAFDQAVQFLDTVLPDTGVRVLAYRPGDWPAERKGLRHSFLVTNEALARATLDADGRGATTYFALAGFDAKPASRKAEHALALKCLWLDMDAKHYGSMSEITGDIGRVARVVGMPSFIVRSGGGVHAYWVLDRALPTAQWKVLADAFQGAWQALGVKADPISADAARVLRVPGTHNRKPEYGEPREVTIAYQGEAVYDPDVLTAKLHAITPPRPHAVPQGAPVAGLNAGIITRASMTRQEVEAALAVLSPDMEYSRWVKAGMAVRHELGDEGFAIWDSWSSRGATYPGQGELEKKWASFSDPRNGAPVTGASLIAMANEAREKAGKRADGDAPAGAWRANVVSAASITPRPIRWLWPAWLAKGKLAILAGQAGTGKSTLTLGLVAALSCGGRWPDGEPCTKAGNSIIWSSEDDPSDTLVPRLQAMGADLSKVHIIQGKINERGERDPFDPATDMPLLKLAAAEIGGVDLMIFDPIVSAVRGDAHHANDVRRGLQAVVDFAAEQDAAVIGISHFGKGTKGSDPQERVIGSQAFAALARVVLVAGRQEDSDTRVLARAKSNISVDSGGIGYGIEAATTEAGIATTRVYWGGRIEGTAREILGSVEADDSGASESESCKQFLVGLLSDGPVPSRQIKAGTDAAGHAWATVRRVQKLLGVEVFREGEPGKRGAGNWMWKLPAGLRCSSPMSTLIIPEDEHLNQSQYPCGFPGDSTPPGGIKVLTPGDEHLNQKEGVSVKNEGYLCTVEKTPLDGVNIPF